MYPLAVDQIDLLDPVADVIRGRVSDAIRTCRARRELDVDESYGCGDGAWAAIETFARSFTIDPGLVEHARRSIIGLRSVDPLGLRYVGSGIAALAIAQAGEIDEATRAWDLAAPTTEGERRSGLLLSARLLAWQAAMGGDTDRAADIVAEAGQVAVEGGHLLWGLLGLHDAVRFGRAERVVSAIDRLCAQTGVAGALPDAVARHARAAAARDPRELGNTVDTFVAIGATRLAVEAAAQAGRMFDDLGDRTAARRSVARAQVLAGGPLPPITTVGGPTGALTDRQAEIVVLLVAGLTGPEIADRLSLSVRTVENHVAAVHRALGVSSRRELLAAVGAAGVE
jgi:DNA-binding CsgD family transcriptional regulator